MVDWKWLAVVALALVVTGVVAFAVGFGPTPGGDAGSDGGSLPADATSPTTETVSPATDGDGGTAGDGTTTTTGPPFTFVVDDVEECDSTCREVTTTLTNEQSTAATDVQVTTRIHVGKTTDGDVVWEGSEPVGDLDAGESYTATRRVELSLMDAYRIQQHDGWITIRTTVTSDGETMTFTQQRDVA